MRSRTEAARPSVGDNRSAELFGQRLQSRRLIDGRTEHREGEPLGEPDISEHDVADMKAEAIAERCDAGELYWQPRLAVSVLTTAISAPA